MTIQGFWPWIKKVRYKPSVVSVLQQLLPALEHITTTEHIRGHILVDFNAFMYFHAQKQTLWNCHAAFEAIHNVLISKFQTPDSIILFIDGDSAEQKDDTTLKRWEKRHDSLIKAIELLPIFQGAVDGGKGWPGKKTDRAFRSSLQNAWYLSTSGRQELGAFLRSKGWSVEDAKFEADVAIARKCLPQDIVVSTDSDMFGYRSVRTIARPAKNSQFAIYKKDDVISHLRLPSDAHLQALAIVSHNDYSSNIHSLGPATNIGVIRELPGANTGNLYIICRGQQFFCMLHCGFELTYFCFWSHTTIYKEMRWLVHTLIQQYLAHPLVQIKNSSNKDFDIPYEVFVGITQTASSQSFSQYRMYKGNLNQYHGYTAEKARDQYLSMKLANREQTKRPHKKSQGSG